MVEFGEKLKMAREDKGMTQQTLADYLYVTRQAVSRWECGARYPDLLTAKKLSDILEVSLDELLSGEEVRKCVEKSQIIESQIPGRVQSALYALTGIAYLLMSIMTLKFLVPEFGGMRFSGAGYAGTYLAGYVLLMASMFFGMVFSIRGKLTPLKVGAILTVYFGVVLCSNIFELFQISSGWIPILQSLVFVVCITIIIRYFIFSKSVSPVPIYLVALFELFRNGMMFFQMLPSGNDLAFAVRITHFAAIAGYMVLMAYQADVLEKKRKLALR